jgi:hypothetical protein
MKVYVIATNPKVESISNYMFYIDKDEADTICTEMNDVYMSFNNCKETPWSVYEAEITIKVDI